MSPEITRSKLNVLKVVGKFFQPNTTVHLQKRSISTSGMLAVPLHIGQWAKFEVPKMKQLRPV